MLFSEIIPLYFKDYTKPAAAAVRALSHYQGANGCIFQPHFEWQNVNFNS